MTNRTRTCLNCETPLDETVRRKFCGNACRKAHREATAPECAFEGCLKPRRYSGLCSGHAEQKRLGRALAPLRSRPGYKNGIRCAFQGCAKYARCNLLCWGHAEQQQRGRELTDLRERQPTNIHARRDALGRKHCGGCDQWLTVEHFTRRTGKADGFHYQCRQCVRYRRLQKRFELTPELYEAIFNAQGRACAICREPEGDGRRFAVDHDHGCCPTRSQSCGECVRGILCGSCNMVLGAMQDDPQRLLAAVRYLEVRSERRVERQ